jgi:hypothetical protein
MSYFSLRKRDPEPVEEDLDEAPEETGDAEPEAEQQPSTWVAAVLVGVRGPGAWIAGRFGIGTAWTLHIVAAWACFYYGGWAAAGIVLAWLLAVGLFMPREHLDHLSGTLEQLAEEHLPQAVQDADTGVPEEPSVDPRHALARWLLDTIDGRPGIHLRELYPAMRNLPGQEGRTDAELRALLEGFGVPVSRSVRIGRIAGRSGVYRRHVEALLSSTGEPRVDSSGDAGQCADSPPLSTAGEGA